MVGTVTWLDGKVAWPEYGEAPPCYVTEDDETICPEPEHQEPSALRKFISVVSAEALIAPLALISWMGGVGCSITALVRTRASRKVDLADKRTFRVALAALLLLFAIPLVVGFLAFLVIATFQIRG